MKCYFCSNKPATYTIEVIVNYIKERHLVCIDCYVQYKNFDPLNQPQTEGYTTTFNKVIGGEIQK